MNHKTTEEKPEEPNLVVRSLKTGILLTLLTTFLLFNTHHANWAWGFLIGSLISLFSLFSLFVVVPILSCPTAPRLSEALLLLVLFMKLPIYAISLYLVTNLHGVDGRAAIPGLTLTPMVITFKTIGKVLIEAAHEAERKREIRRPRKRTTISATRVRPTDPIREQG